MLGPGKRSFNHQFDAIFVERSINHSSPAERLAARRSDIALLGNELIDWIKREGAKLSRHSELAKAMELGAQAPRHLHALPRRRPHLLEQQCGRLPAPTVTASAPRSC